MFEIIQTLRRAKAPVTAEDLADALEVTKRTVYRDIAALQGQRVPIEGEAGLGYILRPGYDLPPLMFGTEEVEAISVGLALLARSGDVNAIPSGTTGPEVLREAIRTEEVLLLCYEDEKKRQTTRTIKPLALIYYVDALVIAAWCELRQDFRHFRLDRVKSYAATDRSFAGEGSALRSAWEARERVEL